MPRRDESHPGVTGTTPALRHDPGNVLGRVLDVTGFAVNTILRIDLKSLATFRFFNYLVNAGWAVTLCRLIVFRQVHPQRDGGICEAQMTGLILSVIRIGQKYR